MIFRYYSKKYVDATEDLLRILFNSASISRPNVEQTNALLLLAQNMLSGLDIKKRIPPGVVHIKSIVLNFDSDVTAWFIAHRQTYGFQGLGKNKL